jgi:hypothetical protein
MDQLQIQMAQKFGHNLGAVWPAFEAVTTKGALDRFDPLVPELQKWEAMQRA